MDTQAITVESTINVPVAQVWELWTDPTHITKWCQASDDWHAPRAENDLRNGGRFLTRMEAKDGSAGFDFSGTYTRVEPHAVIEYTMDDGRKVIVHFEDLGTGTKVTETFEPEHENTPDLQRSGWQSILDGFTRYAEATYASL